MHEKRFDGDIERLRNPERLARLEVERVVNLALEGITAHSVLDIGTGSGIFAEAFFSHGLAADGVDANPEMEVHFRNFVPEGRFFCTSAEALTCEDGAYDLVFLGHVLHESDEPLKVLREAHRVARLRVMILEWPYREEEMGPPLAHRLKSEKVIALGLQVGFTLVESLPLSYMTCFRLES
jgi:ubiquinone/menaquinone biosynthesis C-methylase UbiE